MAKDLKNGDLIEAIIPDWLALSENLRDSYNLPVTRVVGRVSHISAKSIFVDLTEPVQKRIFLALSLVSQGKIEIGILNSASADEEPEAFSGTIAKEEKPFPHGRIYMSDDKKYLYAETPYEMVDRCRMVLGGRFDYDVRAWRWLANPITAMALYDAFQGTLVNQNDLGYQALITAGKELDKVGNIKFAEEHELAQPEGLRTRLWLHQLRAFHFASALPSAAFFMAMGTGKTAATLAYIVHNNIKRTLVLAPRSVVAVWPKDVKKHSEREFIVCALDKGSVASKVKRAQEALAEGDATGKPVIIVVNYESAWRAPFGIELDKDNRIKETGFAFKNNFDLFVLDESHRIKNAQARTAKFCHRLANRVPRKLLLTGTPMPHDPLDIFSQFLVLDGGATFGKSFTKFRERYAKMGGFGGYQVLGYKNIEELQAKMYRMAFRVTEDVVELPERVFTERYGTLSPKERTAYDQMEEDFVVSSTPGWETVEVPNYGETIGDYLDENGNFDQEKYNSRERQYERRMVIGAENVLSQILKLAQLAAGFIIDEDGNVTEYGTSRLDLLMEVLEDIDKTEPLAIFVRFKHDIEAISKRLTKEGYTVAELSGRRNQLADWQDGKYQVIVVQLQSGGVGVDLTKSGTQPCKYCIYYGKDYNWGNYVQSLKRIHRPGQTETVRFISLVMEDTVDETIEDVLSKRGNLVESVLAARSLKRAADFVEPQGEDIDLMREALNDAIQLTFGS